MTNAPEFYNFNLKVPEEVCKALRALAEAVETEVFFMPPRGETYGARKLDVVRNGFEVTELFGNTSEPDKCFTEKQKVLNLKREEDAYASFQHANPELPENWTYNELPPDLQTELNDVLYETFMPAEIRFSALAGTPTGPGAETPICLRLSIEYSGSPGPSGYDEILFERTVPASKLPGKNALIKALKRALIQGVYPA